MEIEAWQTARGLARLVYKLSSNGAFGHDFGLRDQMRRAAVSIMSNIAEGFESRTERLFIDLLGRAKASAGELRAQVYVAHDAQFLTDKESAELHGQCETCSSQLCKFIEYLTRTNQKDRRIQNR